jgi:hypothetical protein
MKKSILLAGFTALMSGAALNAQVTIGMNKSPESFSVLELISNNARGLRLPRLTTSQRNTVQATPEFIAEKTDKAIGLTIFNITTGCVETWNGTFWISKCADCDVPAPSQTSMVLANTEQGNITVGDYPQFRFYAAATGGEPLADSTVLVAGTYYISAFGDLYCESSRTPLSVTFANPTTDIPIGQGGSSWGTIKWVGAFWKDDQTGERIIASTSSGNWVAEIYEENGSGSWLTLDKNGGFDPNLWKANPGDAENYQLPATRITSISGSGNILFRIGAMSKNTNADATYDTGNKPRYAKVLVSINNGTPSAIYCRQGHSADYVFSPSDNINGGAGSGGSRNLAAKFSPYNLTDHDLTESVLSHKTSINGGKFVDFPTQAGAFWQWGTDKSNSGYNTYLRMAYHPANPPGTIFGWDKDYIYPSSCDTWDKFTGNDRLETCPSGWRRPMAGDTTSLHNSTLTPANTSELMQSLFYITFDGSSINNNNNNYRSFGYYADGYFDRRPIVTAVGNNAAGNSAVSASTKAVAYTGILYTHPTTNASLFTPATGYRHDTEDGKLNGAGSVGRNWSSSAANADNVWYLDFDRSSSNQNSANRSDGFAVRCVKE